MGDIDLKSAESRAKYLKENLGQLMGGIDSNYGKVLMDELMRRMEATVSEFNEEVKAMLDQLQGKKPVPKDNILASAPKPQATPAPQAAPRPPSAELKPAPEKPQPEAAPAPAPEPPVNATVDAGNEEMDKPDFSDSVKEVEIEVDLDDEALSDFEKKLRALSR